MAREHLKLLEQFLRSFPKDKYHKFDMRIWVGRVLQSDDEEAGNDFTDRTIGDPTIPFASLDKCNTAGCAIGFACGIPEIKKAGLYLDSNSSWPTYGSEKGYHALSQFFEISTRHAEVLFNCHEYEIPGTITPYDVAERIAWVLAGLKDESLND